MGKQPILYSIVLNAFSFFNVVNIKDYYRAEIVLKKHSHKQKQNVLDEKKDSGHLGREDSGKLTHH